MWCLFSINAFCLTSSQTVKSWLTQCLKLFTTILSRSCGFIVESEAIVQNWSLKSLPASSAIIDLQELVLKSVITVWRPGFYVKGCIDFTRRQYFSQFICGRLLNSLDPSRSSWCAQSRCLLYYNVLLRFAWHKDEKVVLLSTAVTNKRTIAICQKLFPLSNHEKNPISWSGFRKAYLDPGLKQIVDFFVGNSI